MSAKINPVSYTHLVHLPCYTVIIASFVTIVQMFMQAYMESLYKMCIRDSPCTLPGIRHLGKTHQQAYTKHIPMQV